MIVHCELCGKPIELNPSKGDEEDEDGEVHVVVSSGDQWSRDSIYCLPCFYILFRPLDMAYA